MEWYWCKGDWNCWATWFWSNSTAAWVQAILTVVAIAGSVGVSMLSIFNAQRQHERQIKESRAKAIHDQVLQHHKGIVRAKVIMSRLGGGAENIIKHIHSGLSYNAPATFRLVLSERLETVVDDLVDLRKVMLGDLPNPGVIVLVNNGVIIGEDFKAYLAYCLSDELPKVDLITVQDVSNRMKNLHDHLQDYHENYFMNDADAVPKEFEDISAVSVDHAAP